MAIVARAMVGNPPRADAVIRAIPFVRRTRREAGVLVTPGALTRCVWAVVSLYLPFAFACRTSAELRAFL